MKKSNYKNLILIIGLSLLLGVSFSLKRCIKLNEFINSFNILSFILWSLLFTFVSFVVVLGIIYLVNLVPIKKGSFSDKKLIIVSSSAIFFTGLLFLIVYYPGVGFYDTFLILDHPVAAAPGHPLFYNLITGIPFRVFNILLKNVNIAYFLTSLCQLIFCSSILTYIIYWFNKNIKCKPCTVILLLYFSLLPIISNYNMMLLKDSLFGVIFILFVPLIYELIKSNGNVIDNNKYLVKMGLLFLLVCLLRNNGIYVILFTLFFLIVIYRKYYKKLICLLFIVLILSHIPNLFLKNEILFQEKVGIPIQQIAYVVKYNEDSISSKDKAYLNKIIDLKIMKEKYDYSIVDPIKWDVNFNGEYLNRTKSKFITTWFSIMKNNFSNYVKSYLLMTYNLWAIDRYNPFQSRMLDLDLAGYVDRSDTFKELENNNILPSNINNSLKKFYSYTTIYVGNGLLFFSLLIVSLYVYIKDKRNYLLMTLPLIGLYLTLLISIPVSCALRYMSSYLYCLPIVILLFLVECKKSK